VVVRKPGGEAMRHLLATSIIKLFLLSGFTASVALAQMLAIPAGEEKPPANNIANSATAPAAGIDPPSVSKAMHLYRDGKLDDAAAEYRRVIGAGISAPAGYAGLARVNLRQHRVDEAAAAAAKAVELGPNLAASHVALGEVYIRQGRLDDAAEEFRKLVAANTSDARAYYGLARIYHLASYHKKESILINRAHELDPDDPEIQFAWLRPQGWEARIKVTEETLEKKSLDPEARKAMETYLEIWKKYAAEPPRPCSLAPGITSTETPLKPIMATARVVEGYGLGVKVNGTPSTLLLDTGAGGILINQRIADKAGVEKILDQDFTGIGDKPSVPGYLGYAKTLKIGDFEFRDCYVDVIEKSMNENADGLLGANVFAHFLVELNFPDQTLRISPLPVDPAVGIEKSTLDSSSETIAQPHDRYLSPDMKDFFLVYLNGHNLMIPTKLNDQSPFLFILDTGAQMSMVSLAAAKRVGKVSEMQGQMRGIGGKVKNVYRAEDVHLQFANFRQKMGTMISLDLTHMSDTSGLELSGFLGFGLLYMMDITIDYRDGLLRLKFDAKRFYTDVMPQQSYTH
jgi:tetratricopeptide (TPR) repeat protein